ncbi:MAG TPA: YciI family protein [Bryobacteraceae bacterium]|jgi:hypothetical protein|nr:YciI family protein [Bryobacteraceae bacterium]
MRYMFLVYSKEQGEPDPEALKKVAEGHRALMEETSQRGVLRAGEPLEPVSSATTIRYANGEAMITDGPFAETKEQLAGYYILDCKDLDEALEWARKMPTGCFGGEGSIEVRPVRRI